jgi:hypothetical protein
VPDILRIPLTQIFHGKNFRGILVRKVSGKHRGDNQYLLTG